MGVADFEPREEAEPDRLRDEGEGAGNERLRGDDGRRRRKRDHRHDEPLRREGEEQLGVGDRRAADQIGALAEIVEEERRIDDCVPGEADRQGAEMADVGVHRFSAGDDQHHGAEDEERLDETRMRQKRDAIGRIEGGEDLRMGQDRGAAERGDGEEPDEHDRPEHRADAGGALELDGEQRDEQPERDRNDRAGKCRRGDREALDGGEHADRRRDHAVADEQARAGHQGPEQHAGAAVRAVVQQAVEGEHAALAVVLRLEHEQRILDRDNGGQRPDCERDRPERVARRSADDLVHGVERGGADRAEHDAERAKGQRDHAAARQVIMRQPGGPGAMRTIDEERHRH